MWNLLMINSTSRHERRASRWYSSPSKSVRQRVRLITKKWFQSISGIRFIFPDRHLLYVISFYGSALPPTYPLCGYFKENIWTQVSNFNFGNWLQLFSDHLTPVQSISASKIGNGKIHWLILKLISNIVIENSSKVFISHKNYGK